MDTFDFNTPVNRRGTDSNKWSRSVLKEVFDNPEAVPMFVADMDFRCAPCITQALVERAQHGIFGYRDGNSHLDAFKNWEQRRHGWSIDTSWVLQTQGVVPAIRIAIQRFSQPGDKVLIQQPVYAPFIRSILHNGRKPSINELILKNGRYEIDFDDFEKRVRDPDLKIFVLCSPHNPVGRVWSETELRQMAELCLENRVLMVVDEIHNDLIMDGQSHHVLASLDRRFEANAITCMSPSKTFNIAGLYQSNIVIPNDWIRQEFWGVIHRLGEGVPNIFGAIAAEAAYTGGDLWVDELCSYLTRNLAHAKRRFANELSLVKTYEHQGTYLLWLDFRSLGLSDKELFRLLSCEAGVALSRGIEFGQGGSGFMRLNFGCPRAQLDEALDRIIATVKANEEGR